MGQSQNRTEELLRQQNVLARFGEFALRTDDLDELLKEACRLVGESLGTDLAKVMEVSRDGGSLIVRAGVGWNPGIIGSVHPAEGETLAETNALRTGEPVVCPDVDKDPPFTILPFLRDHGVRALVNVIIDAPEQERPFGVLQVDSREPRTFDSDDISYLQTYANVLSAAISRQRTLDRVRVTLEERDRLFETNQQPLLVLSPDLKIVRANRAFEKAFDTPRDTISGTPFATAAMGWNDADLRERLGRDLPADQPIRDYRIDCDFPSIGRRTMLLNVNRIHREPEQPDRLLVAFNDITDAERYRERLEAQKEFAEKTVDAVREALLTLDFELRVQTANQSFYDLFQVSPEETMGRMVYELGNGQWDIPELRKLLEDVLPDNDTFDDYEVDNEFPNIGRRLMKLNARRLDHQQIILLAIRDVTETRKAAEQQRVLMGELQHRVKNILANVRALSQQTRRNSTTLDEFTEAFDSRLDALARVQDLLMRSSHRAVPLADLVQLEVSAHLDEAEKASVEGPGISFPPQISQAIVMVVHELLTNAMKYGALATETGRIEVRWAKQERNGTEHLHFRWRERGVEITDTAPKRGFGSQVIERSLPYMLGGTSDLTFHSDGVECVIDFPLPKEEGGGEPMV